MVDVTELLTNSVCSLVSINIKKLPYHTLNEHVHFHVAMTVARQQAKTHYFTSSLTSFEVCKVTDF